VGAYRETYDRSLTDPGGFWADAAAGIDWTQPPNRVLDDVDAPL
jgi:propionyl-CoA synthetase